MGAVLEDVINHERRKSWVKNLIKNLHILGFANTDATTGSPNLAQPHHVLPHHHQQWALRLHLLGAVWRQSPKDSRKVLFSEHWGKILYGFLFQYYSGVNVPGWWFLHAITALAAASPCTGNLMMRTSPWRIWVLASCSWQMLDSTQAVPSF